MPEIYNDPPTGKTSGAKVSITGQITKPMTAVHDPDINLGHQLEVTDAPNWGRDPHRLKQLSSSVTKPGGGKGGVSGEAGSGNAGKNYGAASNSGDNSATHSAGTSSQTGVPTTTGEGHRASGSAGIESNSAREHKQ